MVEITVGAVAGNAVGPTLAPWVDYFAGFRAILLTFVAGAEIDAKVARKNLWSSLTIGVTGFFAPCLGVLLFARFVVGQARPARSLQHHGSSDGGGQCRDVVRFFIRRLRGRTSAEFDRGGTAEA